MTLYGIMFDHVSSLLLTVTVGCVRAKASVCPHISDDVVMHVVVKGEVFEFIRLRRTKNSIVLCESRQDWFEFVVMYKTRMPHANFLKKLQWEGIQLCEILEEQDFLNG